MSESYCWCIIGSSHNFWALALRMLNLTISLRRKERVDLSCFSNIVASTPHMMACQKPPHPRFRSHVRFRVSSTSGDQTDGTFETSLVSLCPLLRLKPLTVRNVVLQVAAVLLVPLKVYKSQCFKERKLQSISHPSKASPTRLYHVRSHLLRLRLLPSRALRSCDSISCVRNSRFG